ncbi:MAG: hypothetical protein [Microviridae sp.]|nr:MAG: hypothetical protein [Microviridae sp.]
MSKSNFIHGVDLSSLGISPSTDVTGLYLIVRLAGKCSRAERANVVRFSSREVLPYCSEIQIFDLSSHEFFCNDCLEWHSYLGNAVIESGI